MDAGPGVVLFSQIIPDHRFGVEAIMAKSDFPGLPCLSSFEAQVR